MPKIICDKRIKDDIQFGIEIEVGKEEQNLSIEDRKSEHPGVFDMIHLLKNHSIKVLDYRDFQGNWKLLKSWVVGYDSSIDFDAQVELRSPILKGEEGLRHLTDIIKIIREDDWTFDSSCGLHVHLDVNNVNFKVVKNMIIFFVTYEKVINKMLPNHRSHNDYCMELNSFCDQKLLFEKVNNSEVYGDLWELFRDRHVKVNVSNLLESNKTLEFRQHHMTFNRIDIKNWVRFLCYVFSQSNSGKMLEKLDLASKSKSDIPSLESIIS